MIHNKNKEKQPDFSLSLFLQKFIRTVKMIYINRDALNLLGFSIKGENKVSKVEKDIIQPLLEQDVNKDVDEIHKEQNNVENLPFGNIDNEEIIHQYQSLEIEQEGNSEHSDATSQENRVLSEASETDKALEKFESTIDRLKVDDSTESSNENNKSEPINSKQINEQNVVDEISDEKNDDKLKKEEENRKPNSEENILKDAYSEVSTSNSKEEESDDIVTEVHSEKEGKTEVKVSDEQKDNQELSFDEIVSKILTKQIKTNKDFRRVIEGRWAFKRGKTDHDLIPAIKAGKINDSEYDQELVKNNITKLLKKVN